MFKLLKNLLIVGIIGGTIFVGIGDSFLPKPLSTYSRNARHTVNGKMLGLMPPPKRINKFNEKIRDQTDPERSIDRALDTLEPGKK